MRAIAVIPARYASTRLPGKPLLDICGKPMIQRVYEAVQKAALIDEVLVATDDSRIAAAVESFGGHAVMTSPLCASGTDRLVEVSASIQADVYVNVQGDEPLIRPEDIDKLVSALLRWPQITCATPVYPVPPGQARDPNLVKVVRNDRWEALYFSRSPIPYDRDGDGRGKYYGHMGLYAYRPDALRIFAENKPGMLESTEKLEQLRLLQHGIIIQTVEVAPAAPGVDTPEDLERVRAIVQSECTGSQTSYQTCPTSVLVPDLSGIKLIISDVDGVLTDGGLYYGPDGECLKRFCAQDGMGISMLQRAGFKLAILSGRDCPGLRRRIQDLGISLFRLGKTEKREACESLMREACVLPHEALFVGDDIPDLDGFSVCGLGVAVGNARDEVKSAAAVVLKNRGGEGAFRELADMLLQASQ